VSEFTYHTLLQASGGQAWSEPKAFQTARVWTDTRTLKAGDFFLPLSGENFDGHHYLEAAFERGAIGAFVQRDKAEAHSEWRSLPNLIAVDDPLTAYLSIARHYRETINPLVIAVTGSSGKTTTKEMLYAALSPLKKTAKTEKNFNNEVGVCQTLLALEPGTEVLIVEMGMRGLGQIAILSEAARPDMSLIVNIGPAHIGLLGSLENITQAKLEIVRGMSPETGLLVLCGDQPLLTCLAPQVWPHQTVIYSLSEASQLQVNRSEEGHAGVSFMYRGLTVLLPLPGEHMVSNALAVLKTGEALGLSIADLAKGLAQFTPEKGRWERIGLTGYPSVCVINDAYNANPDSAMASLKAFLSAEDPKNRRLLVLGGMKELGDFTQDAHEKLGLWLAAQGKVDALFTIGEEARWIAEAASSATFPVRYAETLEHLAQQIAHSEVPLENAVLYLKGSRAYKLDELPALLTQLAIPGNSLDNPQTQTQTPKDLKQENLEKLRP
jgi:UDP-N-acetylmuramoyl-tripeptide--D-alanyl-D-alanine ligase